MNGTDLSLETQLTGRSFCQEDLERDTVIGRASMTGLVESPGFTVEELRQDTYTVVCEGLPHRFVSLESLVVLD